MSRSNFNGFIGQTKIVQYLRSQLEGTQVLNRPFPHTMIIGPSGMGKTKLAKALAVEVGSQCFVIHGKATPKDLCQTFIQCKKNDFVLLDEAHTLPRASQEALYEVIDGYRMTDRLNNNSGRGTTVVAKANGKLIIQPCTILLATNYPSEILEALNRRMDITVLLHDYTKKELREIISTAASNMNLLFSTDALKCLARSCQGQPAKAVKFVNGIQRMFWSETKTELTPKHVVDYLKSTGRDSYGLDREQQLYLTKLDELGKTSLATISSILGLEPDYAVNNVENGLIRLGYVYRGSGGRTLTQLGKEWVKKRKLKKQAKDLAKLNKLLEKKKEGDQNEFSN